MSDGSWSSTIRDTPTKTASSLGGERISYQELRAFIHEAPADLSLAILDSCESGAFTRHKGGARRAPFLLDASSDTHGHAFLTSSAANEVAQESDRIAASFFTYYLVSGLRGAADANRDRRVTLQEAFQFASQETLARTERTQGGPQHAAYEFDLTGTGDMVVTDVRTTQAGLVLTPELNGRISVREAGGALIAELRKPAGSSVELGLEAGSYVVAVESGGAVKEAQLTLAAGEHLALGGAAFHPGAPLEVAVARGDEAHETRRPLPRRPSWPARRLRRRTRPPASRPDSSPAPSTAGPTSKGFPSDSSPIAPPASAARSSRSATTRSTAPSAVSSSRLR